MKIIVFLNETILFRKSDCLFVPVFFLFSMISGCFWRLDLSKICDNSTSWVEILCSPPEYFLYITKTMEQYDFSKKSRDARGGKSQSSNIWLNIGTLEPIFHINAFLIHTPRHFTTFCKKLKTLSFFNKETFDLNNLYEKAIQSSG